MSIAMIIATTYFYELNIFRFIKYIKKHSLTLLPGMYITIVPVSIVLAIKIYRLHLHPHLLKGVEIEELRVVVPNLLVMNYTKE